jgi:hypothetical protein
LGFWEQGPCSLRHPSSLYRTSGVTKFRFRSSAVVILCITNLKIPVLNLCWLNVSGAGGSVARLKNGTLKVVFVYFVRQSKLSVCLCCTHEWRRGTLCCVFLLLDMVLRVLRSMKTALRKLDLLLFVAMYTIRI